MCASSQSASCLLRTGICIARRDGRRLWEADFGNPGLARVLVTSLFCAVDTLSLLLATVSLESTVMTCLQNTLADTIYSQTPSYIAVLKQCCHIAVLKV